jgi:CspA family cold shock protein
VIEFSAERGLGTISGDDGQTFLFHVIEIADGTRDIEVGQAVDFWPMPKFGTFEAGAIRKV